jgi:hypothetical protein
MYFRAMLQFSKNHHQVDNQQHKSTADITTNENGLIDVTCC